MRPTLHAVLEQARDAICEIRNDGMPISSSVEIPLASLEQAIEHALASSPDGQEVAHAEESVVIARARDVGHTLPSAPPELATRLGDIVSLCLTHAPADMDTAGTSEAGTTSLDDWLESSSRPTN